jgi:Spy/CpxP family protein refolding chaperone
MLFNQRRSTVSLLAAAGLVVASLAHAQTAPQTQPPARPKAPAQGMMGQGMGQGTGPGGLMARLNLTQAQKDQLKAFHDQQLKDRQALREKMRDARQKLRDAMRADVPDENAVRTAAGAVAALQADQAALRARAKGQLMKALTPEQQAQLKEARARVARRAAREERLMMRGNRMMRPGRMRGEGWGPMMDRMWHDPLMRQRMLRWWRDWI